jgi:hypothetical protein
MEKQFNATKPDVRAQNRRGFSDGQIKGAANLVNERDFDPSRS